MRLQVPLWVGPVVDPLVTTKEPQESTTVTPAQIIYHRRVQVLDHAGRTSVTEACRTFGVSPTSYYRWAGRAQRYGLAALLPKDRRPPVMPTATPPDQVEAVLAEAVADPRSAPTPGRPPGRPRGTAVGLRRPEDPPASSPRPPRPAGGRPGPAHRRHYRHPDQPGQGRPVRVLPLRRPPRQPGRPGHLLRRQAQGHRAGLAAHRHGHRHPLRGRPAGRRG
jgi:Helix-turn-helix domain